MKYVVEDSLSNFEFWGGAKDRVKHLDYNDLDIIENYFDEMVACGHEVTDTEINDTMWFEEDFIAELLGYANFDELIKDRHGEEI